MRRPKRYPRSTTVSAALLLAASAIVPASSLATRPPPTPKPPSATTSGVSQLTYSSAVLHAMVNPHGSETTYYFQYGATTAYGSQTPAASAGSGTDGVQVGQAISGLQFGGEYHYRVIATNAVGTTVGQDHLFTTKKIPLRFEVSTTPRLVVFGRSTSIAGSLTGTGAAGHQVVLQTSPFPFLGSFQDLGSPETTNANGEFSFRVSGLSQTTHIRIITLDPLPIRSALMNVRVAPRVSFHVRSAGRPGYVRMYGTVTPAAGGGSVSFQWLRPGRGPSSEGGAPVRKGRFSAVLLIHSGHGGSYRAYVTNTSGRYAPAASRTILVRSAPVSTRKH